MPEIMPELEDAAFCEKLVDEYENDPEKDVSYTLEDCKKEWGLIIQLSALHTEAANKNVITAHIFRPKRISYKAERMCRNLSKKY